MRAGLVILDVSDERDPRHVSTLPVHPPLGSTIALHSAVPLNGRDVVVINSKALGERCDEPAGFAATVDVRDERDPILMALFPQPRPPRDYDASSFCEKGGRFGPHNQHQQQGLACLAPNDRYVYLTYFNAGLQIYEVSDRREANRERPRWPGLSLRAEPPVTHRLLDESPGAAMGILLDYGDGGPANVRDGPRM